MKKRKLSALVHGTLWMWGGLGYNLLFVMKIFSFVAFRLFCSIPRTKIFSFISHQLKEKVMSILEINLSFSSIKIKSIVQMDHNAFHDYILIRASYVVKKIFASLIITGMKSSIKILNVFKHWLDYSRNHFLI